jgi:hypothetical protein
METLSKQRISNSDYSQAYKPHRGRRLNKRACHKEERKGQANKTDKKSTIISVEMPLHRLGNTKEDERLCVDI